MKRPNPTGKAIRRQVVLNFGKPNGRAWHAPDPALPEEAKSERKSAIKASGKRSEKRRTKPKRVAAVRVVCYARPATRAMLVHACRMAHRSLSSFLILSGLGEAARLKGLHIGDLVPQDELEQYLGVKAK